MAITKEERYSRMNKRRNTLEARLKRKEYDKERLKNPVVVARMKAHRQSEHGKAIAKKSQLKTKNTEKNKEYRRKYKNSPKAKETRRNQLLLKNFGITLEKYNKMLQEQNQVCAICLQHLEFDKRSLAVDHCHATGKIRGLLCRHCNQGIGHFKDDIKLLENTIKYLAK